jgi:hypothetical protein
LFGGHQFLIHPIALAVAWTKLYGFPYDPRLWVSFFVHDLGYIGKPNMDGDEGEMHPEFGAAIMRRLFGDVWGDFTLFHSRFYARRQDAQVSQLCVADKLATVVTPRWIYLPLVNLSGEINEYRAATKYGHDYSNDLARASTDKQWHTALRIYMLSQVKLIQPTALSLAALRSRAQNRNEQEQIHC